MAARPASAQDYRARVQGLVTDPSQAAIVGARVTLLNTQTGEDLAKSTNEAGQYRFDFVAPGIYKVTVEASGFSPFVQENITVLTRGDVTVNATMAVGQVTQAINVAETAMEVEFNTTTMSQTVVGKMLSDLPVVARNPYTLVLLDPAVVNQYWDISHRNPFYMQSSNGMDVGGSTGGKNDILLDGIPMGVLSRGSYAPPMDAVQEVAIQQNSVDAEFGESAGGVMNVSMKAGTNEFHGTAYYFGRNPYLNARSNSVINSKNTVRNHIWGGTVGGPVLKNKLFFFFTYEQWRNTQPSSTIRTLPTDLERTGDFSQSLNINGGLRAIYDPLTTVFDPASNTSTRQPFPGNKIPQNRIDPTSAIFMKDIWQPNGPGDNITHVNNYRLNYPWWLHYHNISERTDWNASDKLKVFARYSIFRTRLDNPNYANSPAVPSDNGGLMDALNAGADAVWTVNPTTVVHLNFGTSYVEDDYNSDWSKIGMSGWAKFWPSNAWYTPYLQKLDAVYYPSYNVANSGGSAGFGHASGWWYRPRKYSYQGSLSKDKGRHYMKIGASFRHSYDNSMAPNSGTFYFNPENTADTFISPNTKLSGDGYASMLLGYMTNSSVAMVQDWTYVHDNEYAVFFQDDFKLNRNITLNMGLRYEYTSAPTDTQDRISRYLDLTNPIPEMQATPPVMPSQVTSIAQVPYKWNGAWVYAGDGGVRTLYPAPKLNLLPRLGIAIRLSDKSALRVGYARYAVPMVASIGPAYDLPEYGFSASTYTLQPLQGVPQSVWNNPFPSSTNPLLLPVGKGYGRYTNLGNTGTTLWFNQDLKTAMNERINVTYQRSMPLGFRSDTTFFMNYGYNEPAPDIWGDGSGSSIQMNLADPNLRYTYKSQVDQAVPNPFYQYLTPDKFPGALRNQKTVTVWNLLSPYPQYGPLQQSYRSGVQNRYYALQIKEERPFAHGFTLVMAYNYNHEANSNYFNAIDQYNDRFTMLDSNNPRHRLNIAGTWELPFGKGRAYWNHLHPVLNAIVGGWTTAHIFMWNHGPFVRFGQYNVSGDPANNIPAGMYFNPGVFSIATPYTVRTNPYQYPGVTGPNYWNMDSTLSKSFNITERIRLEFRFEAYNMPNGFVPTNPDTSVTSSTFGRSTSQQNYGREFQYTARIHF
ncbi:MAG TPA: TonB-dependent receptor [Bryobacteraceae bacterium]|nr:TonB-dependent receptor [Bryobacteraceae bacterium]